MDMLSPLEVSKIQWNHQYKGISTQCLFNHINLWFHHAYNNVLKLNYKSAWFSVYETSQNIIRAK